MISVNGSQITKTNLYFASQTKKKEQAEQNLPNFASLPKKTLNFDQNYNLYQQRILKPNLVAFTSNKEFSQTSKDIGKIIYNYLRPIDDGNEPIFDAVYSPIKDKIENFVSQNKTVEFVLPAFPFKSPSSDKCLSTLPDRAEEESLKFLGNICNEIDEKYPPGGKIKIYSDGRVFAGVTEGVNDTTVTDYTNGLKNMVSNLGLQDKIEILTLEDQFGKNYEESRTKLFEQYGESFDSIKQRVQEDPYLKNDFCGIHRYISEEKKAIHPDNTRSKNEKLSKQEAYKTIQAAETWSRYITDINNKSIRLSCHPHKEGSSKVGIYLGNTCNNWMTPWNGVAVELPDKSIEFMQAKQAKDLGCSIETYPDGRPSHYKSDKTITAEDLFNNKTKAE